jgi:hypothetical protein
VFSWLFFNSLVSLFCSYCGSKQQRYTGATVEECWSTPGEVGVWWSKDVKKDALASSYQTFVDLL